MKKNSLTANANKLFIVIILAAILLGGSCGDGSCDGPAFACPAYEFQCDGTIYSCSPSSVFCETRKAEDLKKKTIDVERPANRESPKPEPKKNVTLGEEVGSPEQPGAGSVGFPIVPWTD